ncbi:radical SAM protein [Myxococcota bacterium]|nr:radical SAM protein [Myxococcota bacterium]
MSSPAPDLPFLHLDVLWLQVTGTICNIACRHCFISCGPKVDIHPPMTLAQVEDAIRQAEALGCRAYAFTGGEPFLHPDLFAMIDLALARGPLLILTNGMRIDPATATDLAERARAAEHSLDLRVSLDGLSAEENDPVRGKGVFAAATAGIRNLVAAGLEPTVAVTTVHAHHGSPDGRQQLLDLLRGLGISRPRLKLIPPFALGRQARVALLSPPPRLTAEHLDEDSPWVLQCGTGRMVTARGAWPCPILVNVDEARMGDDLRDALRPCALAHPACHTCHVEAFTCRS